VRSRLTALVILGVLGVGVTAAVDALPETADEVRRPTAPATGTREAVAALRTAGVRGLITYSDAACRLHAVRLPSLRATRAPAVASCKPRFPTGGILAWEGAVVWSGLGFGTVQVVLPREWIERSISRTLQVRHGELRARQAIALGGKRFVMLVEGEVQDRYLAFFEGRRLLTAHALPEGSEDDFLRPSPGGSYVALLAPGRPGVTVFTRAGTPVHLPVAASPHAIAWSPDEEWTALATRASVYVFRSGERTGLLPRIPLAVRDLDWDA
jgi:hypothetical protein